LAALAEALGVLAAELRAGRSVADAATTAVGSCPDRSVAAALGPVLRLGEPPRAAPGPAPDELAPVLARVAAAVRLSARTGCSLAAVVTAVEDDLRARAEAEAELRSAVAGPRASAAVLAGLPGLGLLMGSGVGADPWRVLTTTGTGTVLLVAGVCLEAAGLLWSARLVRAAVRR
jgi:tight adherence protein B